MALKGDTIHELPLLSDLEDAEIELDVARGNGPRVSGRVKLAGVANKPANDTLGAPKYFAYLTQAEAIAAGRSGVATLDQCDPLTVVIGNTAYVDLPDQLELEAAYDNGRGPYLYGNGFRGFYDGSGKRYTDNGGDGLLALKWQLKAPAPNDQLGVPHVYSYLTYQEASDAGRGPHGDELGVATLDQCDPLTVVIGMEVYVDLPGQLRLVAVYDSGGGPYPYGPGFRGYFDGSRRRYYALSGDGLLGLKWVRKGSPEAAGTANVPPWSATYNQNGTPPGYKVDDLANQTFESGTFTFQARRAGQLPAPGAPAGDANWKRFVPANAAPTTNDVLGAPKFVVYLTRAEAAADGYPDRISLEDINPRSVCLRTEASVDHGQLRLTAIFDPRDEPEFRGFVAGDGAGDGLLGMRWVAKDSAAAGVPAYVRLGTDYAFKVDELVRAYVDGNESELFFAAKKEGPLPAPSDVDGDANWRRVAEQDVPPPGISEEQLGALLIAKAVTSAQLGSLMNNNELRMGQPLLLTDYRTVHTIPGTDVLWTGPVEPLLLTAVSTSALAPTAWSPTYPQDIIYYSTSNNGRLPGSTKGYITRRIDTVQHNDIEIDFRNVRLRRWLVQLPRADWQGATSKYLSATDNGAAYQDFPMFSDYSQVRNNYWRGFDQSYRRSIFENLNFVFQDEGGRCINNSIDNSSLGRQVTAGAPSGTADGVTVTSGSWFYNVQLLRSGLSNVQVVRGAFQSHFQAALLNSNLANQLQMSQQAGATLTSTSLLTQTDISDKTYVAGSVYVAGGGGGGGPATPVRNIYIDATGPVGSAVLAGTFSTSGNTFGELLGTQPDGSLPGDTFKRGQAIYEYRPGHAGALVWVRSPVG